MKKFSIVIFCRLLDFLKKILAHFWKSFFLLLGHPVSPRDRGSIRLPQQSTQRRQRGRHGFESPPQLEDLLPRRAVDRSLDGLRRSRKSGFRRWIIRPVVVQRVVSVPGAVGRQLGGRLLRGPTVGRRFGPPRSPAGDVRARSWSRLQMRRYRWEMESIL